MTRSVASSVIIDMPRLDAWQRLRDLSQAHNYVPGIVRTEIVTDSREGVGASRYVYSGKKKYIQETVTEWREGEGFVIKLHRGDRPAPPFREASFRYLLEDAGGDKTRFTASLTYTLPWGGFGRWLEKRMAGFVQSTIADVALAMQLYYETGEPTTDARLKAARAQRGAD